MPEAQNLHLLEIERTAFCHPLEAKRCREVELPPEILTDIFLRFRASLSGDNWSHLFGKLAFVSTFWRGCLNLASREWLKERNPEAFEVYRKRVDEGEEERWWLWEVTSHYQVRGFQPQLLRSYGVAQLGIGSSCFPQVAQIVPNPSGYLFASTDVIYKLRDSDFQKGGEESVLILSSHSVGEHQLRDAEPKMTSIRLFKITDPSVENQCQVESYPINDMKPKALSFPSQPVIGSSSPWFYSLQQGSHLRLCSPLGGMFSLPKQDTISSLSILSILQKIGDYKFIIITPDITKRIINAIILNGNEREEKEVSFPKGSHLSEHQKCWAVFNNINGKLHFITSDGWLYHSILESEKARVWEKENLESEIKGRRNIFYIKEGDCFLPILQNKPPGQTKLVMRKLTGIEEKVELSPPPLAYTDCTYKGLFRMKGGQWIIGWSLKINTKRQLIIGYYSSRGKLLDFFPLTGISLHIKLGRISFWEEGKKWYYSFVDVTKNNPCLSIYEGSFNLKKAADQLNEISFRG